MSAGIKPNEGRSLNEIIKPKHYTQGPIECLDAIESMLTGDGAVDFYRTQVVKCLWRMPHKGSLLVDTKKTDFYLHRLISKLEQSE